MGLVNTLSSCLAVAIFAAFIISVTESGEETCFDMNYLIAKVKNLTGCKEPYDLKTCLEYYECTARKQNLWDDDKKCVRYHEMREMVVKHANDKCKEPVGKCMDDCYKKDGKCGIEYNKCFMEDIVKICPGLKNYMQEPPDCSPSSSSEEEKS